MENKDLTLFEGKKIRRIYDEQKEIWYFSLIDIIGVLTEQKDYKKAQSYCTTLKNRLKKEGSEVVTNCDKLKLVASDGKKYKTDVADIETILRLIQSVPSKKAEPIKMWLAKVAKNARKELEEKTGKSLVSGESFLKEGGEEKIKYITLTGKSTPRSDKNINKFECVTAVIKNKNTGLFLVLEFIREEFGLVGGKIEKGENKDDAIIREIEEETGYKNADIKKVIFEKIYSRGYKARKDSEDEALDKVFYVEVEEKNKSKILGADFGTKAIHWFTEQEMLKKLTLTHHIYFFEEFIKNN